MPPQMETHIQIGLTGKKLLPLEGIRAKLVDHGRRLLTTSPDSHYRDLVLDAMKA
jgi:hypothetical protein